MQNGGFMLHMLQIRFCTCDGRKTLKYGLSQNSPKDPKFKIHQKSITTKSQHHMQPTDSANGQGHQKQIDLFGSALNN
jgi:hypothetical protein